jgi:hypothetical protein
MQGSFLQACVWLHYECRDIGFGAFPPILHIVKAGYEHFAIRVRIYYEYEHSEKVKVSRFHSTPPPDIHILRNVKVLNVSRSTFNEIGRDQYNQHSCYNTFVVHHPHNHFYLRGTLVCDTIMFIGTQMVERTI